MRTYARIGVVIAVVVLAGTLAACGDPARPSASATTDVSPTACVNTVKHVCIVASDNGKTLSASLGATVEVKLQVAGEQFSAPIDYDPSVLRAKGAARLIDGGVVQDFSAIKVGRAALTSTMRPVCAKGKACPQYIALWRVSLKVLRG